MAQWRRIVGVLSGSPVERATDFSRVIDQTLGKLTNRCLIALVSDCFEDPAALRAALARIRHRGHDLILFQIVDDAERTLSYDTPAIFEGLEGEAPLKVDPRAIRQAYVEAFERHLAEVPRLARSFGFDHALVNTHDWLGPPLAAFIARRQAQMKRTKMG